MGARISLEEANGDAAPRPKARISLEEANGGAEGARGKEAKDYAGLKQTDEEFKRDYWQGAERGAKTALYSVGQMINRFVGTPESQRAFDERTRQALPPIQEPSEGMKTGEFVGGMTATAPITTLAPGAASARLLPRMFAGGVSGGAVGPLSSVEPDTTAEGFPANKRAEAAAGAGVGALVPAAISGVRRAISPITNQLSERGNQLAEFYRNNIGQLTPAQSTGSTVGRWVEDAWARLPGSSGPQQRIFAAQQRDYNRAWLNQAGIQADAATPEVLANARTQYFDPAFRALRQNSVVDLDGQFNTDLTNVALAYRNRLPSDQIPIFNAKLNELRQLANPMRGMARTLDGEQFSNVRSPITESIAENGNNPALRNALQGLKRALDAAEERSMGADVREARRALDRQYSIFRSIEDAVGKNPEGNILPAAIEGKVANRFKAGGWAEGRSDTKELVDAGKSFLRPPPSSGTAERTYAMQLATGQAPPIPEGEGGIIKAGAGLVMAPTLQAFANSPIGRWWLTNQLATRAPGLLGTMGTAPGLLGGRLADQQER